MRYLRHRQCFLHRWGGVVTIVSRLDCTDGSHTCAHDGNRTVLVHRGNIGVQTGEGYGQSRGGIGIEAEGRIGDHFVGNVCKSDVLILAWSRGHDEGLRSRCRVPRSLTQAAVIVTLPSFRPVTCTIGGIAAKGGNRTVVTVESEGGKS